LIRRLKAERSVVQLDTQTAVKTVVLWVETKDFLMNVELVASMVLKKVV
jgi:hypothetical protein